MWMLFLSSFINFCLASNLLWSFLCFSFFLAFWPFPWQQQPFCKNQPLRAQLHMAYDIPTRFHKVWSRHLREIEWTKMCGRRIIIVKNRIAIHHRQKSGWCNNKNNNRKKKRSKHNMSPKLRLGDIIIPPVWWITLRWGPEKCTMVLYKYTRGSQEPVSFTWL